MQEFPLVLLAVAAAALTLRLAAGDVEPTLARCCAQGANWAREDKACASFPTPVPGEASEHQSICLTAASICCLRLYRENQCEAGKQAAQKGRDCRLPAAQGGEYYKDCCEGCKLGLVSGAMALSCSFRSLQFGFPWDIAYTQCCTHLHPQLPLLPREAPESDEDNSVLYPGSSPVSDTENLCLQFSGQLCAHVCVPAPGSYTCQCRAGFVLSVDKKTCLQEEPIDRCADNDACEHICRDTGIAVVCACDPGYRLAANDRSCDDIDECTDRTDNCDRSTHFCINTQGSFACQQLTDKTSCPAGYKYNALNKACEDINECDERLDDCSSSAQTCINSVGSYRCIDRSPTCSFGYRYDSDTRECVDIDECVEGRDFCDVLTETCTNLPGGYRCDQLRSIPKPPLSGGESSHLGPLTPLDPFSPESSPNQNFAPNFDSSDDVSKGTKDTPELALDSNKSPDAAELAPNQITTVASATHHLTEDKKSNHSSKRVMQIPSLWVPPDPPSLPSHPDVTSIAPSSPPPLPASTNTTSPPPSPPPSVAATNASTACPPHFYFDVASATCRDVDECQSSPCETEERCHNTLGSYECRCRDGYKLDSGTGRCKDVNECQLGTYDCEESQRCDNTVGSYTCVRISGCGTGYTLNHNNGLCEDNDECESGMHDCGQLGPQWVCINTKGSFRCEKKVCPDLQYLDDFGVCVNVTCPVGYKPDKKSCVDVDECAEPGLANCRSNENCVNLLGSYSCRPKMICSRGFTLDEQGTSCVDIDECATGAHECSGGQQCHNRRGTYTCQCLPGYRLNRLRQCQDIDECTTYYGAACSSNAVCENSPGSFLCHCNDGFEQAEGGRNCIDIDECSRDANACHHRCINIRGGYQCICNAGYNIAADNRTCIDVDECEETRLRGRGRLCVGVCENTPGSFQCACPPGYTLSPDLRTCKDNNECERESVCRGASEQCINTRGGFRCMEIACPAGYIRDTSHKSRCKKRSLYCRKDDLVCHRQPLSYSYNFLPLVSNMSLPSTGHVDLFTMRGPLWATSTVRFALELESVRSPTGVAPAVRESFILRRTSINQAVISLQQKLEGSQEIQLALSMKLYHGNEYSGSAVAKLLIIISEYDF